MIELLEIALAMLVLVIGLAIIIRVAVATHRYLKRTNFWEK
jgi:hypothetical protein